MAENTESVVARRILDPSSVNESGQTSPGDFAWEFDFTHFDHWAAPTDSILTVYIHLPGERGRWTPIHVQRGPAPEAHVWGWDGDLDRPTFVPSIHNPGYWHGHMTRGQLLSVGAAPMPAPAYVPPVVILNDPRWALHPGAPDRRDPRRIGGHGS